MNDGIDWCIDGKINDVQEKIPGTGTTNAKKVLEKSRGY